jgi:phage/plasmid-associated DNA primase
MADSPVDPLTTRAAQQFRAERDKEKIAGKRPPAPSKRSRSQGVVDPGYEPPGLPDPTPKPDGGGDSTKREVAAAPFTEIALAERLVERHPDLRYVADWAKWMRWTGQLWRPDNTLHVYDLARLMAKEVAATRNRKAKEIASAKTVAAIERLARGDRRVAAEAEQWDVDPDIINEEERTP